MRRTNNKSLEPQEEVERAGPSTWSSEDRMLVVARLRDLEVVNQRLAAERNQLQRQLNHVLHRLASDRFSEGVSSLQELTHAVRFFLGPRISDPSGEDEASAAETSTVPAPLASGESINFLSSFMESNGRFSAVEYSSLSDAFEELNLRQDPVSQVSLGISTQNGSSPSASVITGIPDTEGGSTPMRTSRASFPTVIYDSSDEGAKELGDFGPAGMLVSGTMLDTVASSSTHPNDIHTTYVTELPSSSSSPSLSYERESDKWRSLYVCIPPSTSYSLSCSTSLSPSPDSSPSPHGRRISVQPHSPVSRQPFLTSSLPTSPRRLTSRRSLVQCIEDAQKSATKWLCRERNNTHDTPPDFPDGEEGVSRIRAALTPSDPLRSPQDGSYTGDLETRPSVASTGPGRLPNFEARDQLRWRTPARTRRVRTRSHLPTVSANIRSAGEPKSPRTVRRPILIRSIKKSTQTARVRVGTSDDFLNDFFSCGCPDDDFTSDTFVLARAAAVSREFSCLFSCLSAYTCVRKHCSAVENLPADEVQGNIDQIAQLRRLADAHHQFERLCREETSSSDARSTVFIVKSSAQPPKRDTSRHRQQPQPSATTVDELHAASSTSTEYYSPPMEESINQEDPNIAHHGRLMTSLPKGALKKQEVRELSVAPTTHAGKLARLSGRFKVWQTFWCVLVNKSLLFYRDESEVDQWPRKCIDLAEVRSVEGLTLSRTGKPSGRGVSPRGLKRSALTASFNVTLRSGRVYTLRGPSTEASSIWESSIRRALRRIQAEHIFRLYSAQLVISGWLLRYRRGQSHRVWCMLMGTFLVYSREPRGIALTGYRDLSLTYLRCPFKEMTSSAPTVMHSEPSTRQCHSADASKRRSYAMHQGYESSDSESDTGIETNEANSRTLALWAPNRDPVYLVCNTDAEFERWRYHLTRACWFSTYTQSCTKEPEARFLQLWGQLVHPAYVQRRWHTAEPISSPLSRIISEPLFERSAIILSEKLSGLSNLSRSLTSAEIEGKSAAAAPCQTTATLRLQTNTNKAVLVKSLAQMCYDNTALKDELYLQLMKQATPPSTILRTLTDVSAMRTVPTRRRMRMMELLCGSGGHQHREDWPGTRRRVISATRPSEEEGGVERKTVDLRASELSKRPPPSKQTQRTLSITTMWECISIFTTLFLPSPPVLACLQAFLAQFTSRFEASPPSTAAAGGDNGAGTSSGRTKSITSSSRRDRGSSSRQLILELCRFAAFCSDMLLRCRIRGGRKVTPSYYEVVAISLRNPYTHCLPFSLPIRLHLPSGYQVVSFDGTMKISQLTASVVESLGLGEAVAKRHCLCGIFCQITGSARPSGGAARFKLLYLEPLWNICDVISLYEEALSKSSPGVALSLEDMSIDLVFMVQAVGKCMTELPAQSVDAAADSSADRVMDMVAHQLHSDICSGRLNLILRGAHYLELTALMCRWDHCDYAELQRRQETNLTLLVHRYFPRKCISTWSSGGEDDQALIELKLLLLNRWTKLSQETTVGGEQSSGAAKETTPSGRPLPRASQAFVRTLWKLHPAAACVRQFACQVLNCEGVPSTETVWLAPSHERISFLRVYTFDSTVTRLICAGYTTQDSAGMVSGLACFRQIPMANLISFGIQRTGIFFLVFAETHRQEKQQPPQRRHQEKPPRSQQLQEGTDSFSYSGPDDGGAGEVSQDRLIYGPKSSSASRRESRRRGWWSRGTQKRLEKLLLFIPDLCTVNELCHVLTFFLETA
ncbi:Pleckstrin y domain-containing H member 2 [Sparganum proliferum]